MTLSKQKGPRKNGPFCLFIFLLDAFFRLFIQVLKYFAEMQHGESGKKARPLSIRRKAESVSDEIIQAGKKQTKKDPTLCAGQL